MASIAIASADPTAPLQQPVCQNCQTSTTPLWRRDESGSVLCNACGLFLKLHGRPRPISLKTDVIKSRNRVKTATQGPKKKFEQNGGQASVTDNMNPHRRVSQMAASVASDRSQSPISRTGTPGAQHDPNIAPQHLFDGVTALADAHYSNGIPTDPALQLSQPPPAVAALSNGQHGAAPMTYDDLVGLTNSLRTRVSELEVINMVYHDNESNLCRERDRALQERDEYKRKAEELERQLLEGQANDEHVAKRPRLSPDAQAS
ncbi:protein GZF3 [Cladophialophora carrionii CBS 160.54]|uniref:Protein GZF3 n=1 Tax=Cladophialophora carrionii CBS 160.54 TaxID=1279043 RepID=V9CY21_9EURO|nr:protein GZF3 [Cladophialophora carrionii CBS 160.54]ETI19524.1 protein GZF3 [Cladophialophora carrionii CBS 160.54]